MRRGDGPATQCVEQRQLSVQAGGKALVHLRATGVLQVLTFLGEQPRGVRKGGMVSGEVRSDVSWDQEQQEVRAP